MGTYAVIDVETTGLGSKDRILEIAVVLMDSDTFEVVHEFDTLINPMRDVGPTRIHGITASMVSAAPTFADAAAEIGRVLNGSVLVAHNLPFDRRFLAQEFDRLGASFAPGQGLCTLNLTKQKLAQACGALQINLDHAHRALADARACAMLLERLAPVAAPFRTEAVRVGQMTTAPSIRTLRRDAVSGQSMSLRTTAPKYGFPGTDERELAYLQILDRYLSDGHLSIDERAHLEHWAIDLGVQERVPELERSYLEAVVRAVSADGVITPEERLLVESISSSLNIQIAVEAPRARQSLGDSWEGLRVCFTGELVVNGEAVARSQLEALAVAHGMIPVSSVTKKACDLLVCADVSTASGKARKARDFGIPTMAAEDLLRQLRQ